MYTIIPVEVMVLESLDRDDSSAVLVVFSRELGKLYVHAQGIRKLASKHAANVQIGARVMIDIVRGKHEWRLVGSRIIAESKLGTSPERVRFGKLVRVVLDLTAVEDPHAEVYDVLVEASVSRQSKKTDTLREAVELARIVEALGWWVDGVKISEYISGKRKLRDFVSAVNKGLHEAYS